MIHKQEVSLPVQKQTKSCFSRGLIFSITAHNHLLNVTIFSSDSAGKKYSYFIHFRRQDLDFLFFSYFFITGLIIEGSVTDKSGNIDVPDAIEKQSEILSCQGVDTSGGNHIKDSFLHLLEGFLLGRDHPILGVLSHVLVNVDAVHLQQSCNEDSSKILGEGR